MVYLVPVIASLRKPLLLGRGGNFFDDVQPWQRGVWRNQIEGPMDCVVGTNEKFGACSGQLVGRRQHQVGDALPVILINELHVLGKTVGVHTDLRMHVAAHQCGRLAADRAIAQRRTFGAARHNSNMLWHGDSS